MSDTRYRILCVDDESHVLEGLALQLGRRYDVVTALSGADGLEILRRDNTVAVVISDMRMPHMDGAAFLAQARRIAPNAGRILLTGQTDLASAIAAVNEGQILRFLSKPCPPPTLHAAVEAAVDQYRRSQSEQTGLRRILTAQIHSQDALTGLASRTRFQELLQNACDQVVADETRSLAIMLVNLENMRDINAVHGHVAGDQVLQSCARRLLEHCGGALCVARWGDTEFVVLMPAEYFDEAGLMASAEALIALLGEPIAREQHNLRVRASIGIARAPAHASDAEVLMKHATIAAHQGNLQGGGACCMFRADWAHRAEYRYQLLLALRQAIDEDSLHLHFQPIVDLRHGRVRVLEALARWQHPTLGAIPPAQFIALAEESGDMPRLGQWILRRACLDARRLVGVYCERVAVNISMHQLLHDDFFVHLEDALRLSGLATNQLELELTESVFSRDAERVLTAVRELRKRGISVAIDDFGTGYSSLAYLQRFPADVIKVDRSFTSTIGRGGETIIAAAQSIGRSFGMAVVIEGVEDEATLQKLQALDVTLFQGYHFAKPMPLEAIDSWFRGSGFTVAGSPAAFTAARSTMQQA